MFKGKKLQIGLGAGSLLVVAVLALLPVSYQALRQQHTSKQGAATPKFTLPSGSQTYSIAQAAEAWPKITEATINPPDVHVGDTQTIEAVIESRAPLTDVSADIETDHGTVHLKLDFVGIAQDGGRDPFAGIIAGHEASALQRADAEQTTKGRYRGTWVVQDTHDTTYHTTINATAGSDHSSVVLAWSDACSIPLSGSVDMKTPCTISSADGVETGDLTVETSLTLNADFAFNGGYQVIISSGSLSLCNGCNLLQSNVWMLDADADGYPGNGGAQFISSQTPLGGSYRRRAAMTDYTPDCDDSVYSSTNTCSSTELVVYYDFEDVSGNAVIDHSGYANTGYLDAEPKSWETGYAVNGREGFGMDATNRTMTIPNGGSLQLTGDKSFNFLWYNPNSGDDYSGVGDLQFINKGTDNEFNIELESGGRVSGYGGVSSGWAVLAESGHGYGTWWPWMREGATLQYGDWHMVTLVLSGHTGTMYEDGVELQSVTGSGTTDPSGNDVIIGNLASALSGVVVLDEFQIYNGALTQSDISNLAANYGCDSKGCTNGGGGGFGGGPLIP